MEQFPEDPRQVVRSQNEDGTFNFGQVDVSELSTQGRFGLQGTSFSTVTVGIGFHDFLLVEDADFRVNDDVQIIALDDPRVSIWGEVVDRTTSAEGGTVLTVVTDDLSALGSGTAYSYWQLQIVARPKPGIEKDTSSTSVDPTTDGPWTFTVTADKFWPLGGTLLIKPTADRSIAVIGEVEAYSGTSLTVSLRATNATVSQSYTSWAIALLDSPPPRLNMDQVFGLVVQPDPNLFGDANHDVKISVGSVRDSTDTVDLVLTSALVKKLDATFAAGTAQGAQVLSSNLAGTITSTGTAVAGTGTAFSGDFGSLFKTITSGGVTSKIASLTDQTTLTTVANLGVTNATYQRGGYTTDSGSVYYDILLIRKDSDGSLDVCASQSTIAGIYDLPSGYTYYRVIAVVEMAAGVISNIVHELDSWETQEYVVSNATTVLPNALETASSTSIIKDLSVAGQHRWQRAALTGDVTASANSNATTIANDAVSNAKLANMAAYTIKGRNAGTSGDPSDIDITALTTKASPASGDYVLITDGAASNAFKKADVSTIAGTSFPQDMGLITEASTTTFDLGTIV